MDNTTLGTTMLEHIPEEILHPKRKTNRLWTLGIIFIVTVLALWFWNYRQHSIQEQTQEVVPVTTPPKTTDTMSMGEIEKVLSETEIPSFHETL